MARPDTRLQVLLFTEPARQLTRCLSELRYFPDGLMWLRALSKLRRLCFVDDHMCVVTLLTDTACCAKAAEEPEEVRVVLSLFLSFSFPFSLFLSSSLPFSPLLI